MTRALTAMPFVAALICAACTAITSTEGLVGESDGGGGDEGGASGTDAAASDARSGSPPLDAARACPCPAGSKEVAGVCVVDESSAMRTCTAPLQAPSCETTFEVTLCSDDPVFAYDTACIAKARQSAFFALGSVASGAWHVVAQGVDVLARTDVGCTKGVPQCALGPKVTGELSPNGTTIAIGKAISAGCTTVHVDIGPGDAGRD